MVPDPAPDTAPAWLVRSAAVGGRLLVLAVLVWLLAGLAVKLTALVVAVLVGLLLAGVATPAVQWADRHGVPRTVSAVTAVGLLVLALAGAALGLGARIAGQLPQLRDQLTTISSDLSRRFGIELPSPAGSGGGQGSGGATAVGDLLGPLQAAGEVLIAAFLALALAFLFLVSGRGMWQWLLGKFGGRVREDVDGAGRAAWQTTGAYVRGLTVVALFDAVGIGVGLLLIGVPLALTLAALQFLASYIPTIGAFVAGAVAVVVAYGSGGLVDAALVAVLVLVVQQVGNDVIEPWVMRRRLPLNAAAVLVAVTAGGLLWGLAGALLFVPLAAAASAAAHELWVRRGSPPVAGGEASAA
ncbi:AI-2E family transporter [Geodermatophilus sp. SYSU D00758]